MILSNQPSSRVNRELLVVETQFLFSSSQSVCCKTHNQFKPSKTTRSQSKLPITPQRTFITTRNFVKKFNTVNGYRKFSIKCWEAYSNRIIFNVMLILEERILKVITTSRKCKIMLFFYISSQICLGGKFQNEL